MIEACRCWLPTLMATRGRARPTSENEKRLFQAPTECNRHQSANVGRKAFVLSHQSRRRAFILFHAPGELAPLLANSEKRLNLSSIDFVICQIFEYLKGSSQSREEAENDWESGSEASFYDRDAGIYSSVNWCSCSSFLSSYLFLSCQSKWWLLRYLLFYK